MNPKTYKAPGLHKNNSVSVPSLQEKAHPGFIQPIYNRPLYFTVSGNVEESFIVDWQLDQK
ncbi:MAG: hypothetical protein ACM3P1_04565 [Candidatus Saccharibacteria bacterium]